jgi:hypothetical protein
VEMQDAPPVELASQESERIRDGSV